MYIDPGLAVFHKRADELVGNETMRVAVSTDMADLSRQAGLPEGFHFDKVHFGFVDNETAFVFALHFAGDYLMRAQAFIFGIVTHFVAMPLASFNAYQRTSPAYFAHEGVALVGTEECSLIPERVTIRVVVQKRASIAPTVAGYAYESFAGDGDQERGNMRRV